MKTNYQEFSYEESTKILTIIWQKNTSEMNDEEYKDEQMQTLKFIRELHPNKLLINSQSLDYVINPEMQIWTDENLVKPCIEVGIEKFAFVMPADLFALVSIEQAVEENESQLQRTKFFDSVDTAKHWLIEG